MNASKRFWQAELNCDWIDDPFDEERANLLWSQFFGRLSGLQVFSEEIDPVSYFKVFGLCFLSACF